MQNPQEVKTAASELQKLLPTEFTASPVPPVAIILGTGLSTLIENFPAKLKIIPFAELPNFPTTSVDSHPGSFAAGLLGELPVIIQQGRCHLYEGRTPQEICMGVRVMATIGARELIITNAAGSLNPLFQAGSLMCMADIINHTGLSPLTGANCFGERFPDMTEPFATDLRNLAMETALKLGIRLNDGVYIGLHGPEMETRAETRMYRQWGADAVGMSTVLEVIAANHIGLKCLGISSLTNCNLPDCMKPAPLEEIVRVAGAAGLDLAKLLLDILRQIPELRQ